MHSYPAHIRRVSAKRDRTFIIPRLRIVVGGGKPLVSKRDIAVFLASFFRRVHLSVLFPFAPVAHLSFSSALSRARPSVRVLRFFLEPSGVIIRYSPLQDPLMEFACKSETGFARGCWGTRRRVVVVRDGGAELRGRDPGVKQRRRWRGPPFSSCLRPLLARAARVDGGVHKTLRALILFCVSGTSATASIIEGPLLFFSLSLSFSPLSLPCTIFRPLSLSLSHSLSS